MSIGESFVSKSEAPSNVFFRSKVLNKKELKKINTLPYKYVNINFIK